MPFATRSMHVAASTAFLMQLELSKCTGCIHGKHTRIKWPEYLGKPSYNCIQYFTVILQGADGNYRFLCIRVCA